MSNQAPIFEETVRNYLNQVAQIDRTRIAETLGLRVEQGEVFIPFFGRVYRVSPSGMSGDYRLAADRLTRSEAGLTQRSVM